MATVTEAADTTAAASLTKRPTRPDQAAFESGVEALEKELKAKTDKQDYFVGQLKLLTGNSAQNERQKELKEQLGVIRVRQAEIRAANQKVLEEIKTLDEGIKRKVKEVQAAKSKLSFKSPEDLDAQIKKFESMVDSGTLKLVDEKRMLSDITALKKTRKNFSSVREIEQSIAEAKAKVAALRAKTEDKESKDLSAEHNVLQTELNGIYAEIEKAQKNRSALTEQRNVARQAKDEAYQALRNFKNEFYKQKKEFAHFEQAERQKRWERKKAEREEFERERRKRRAAQRLETASQPAFEDDIAQAESLLQYFDPSFKPSATSTLRSTSSLAAQATRTVDPAPPAGTQIISRKIEEDYFVGKKNKKRNNTVSAPAEKEKFTLNLEIVNQLGALSIGVPTSREEVPPVVASLKEKITWFKENQASVTAENIKKAEAEIEKLESEATAETEAAASADSAKEPKKRTSRRNGKTETDITSGTATPSEAAVETVADAEIAAEVKAEQLKPAEQ
ncbi:hypothetical protein V1512DRAFT_263203 [Lipomyces arxii]|uniref:uncharacterized protein n=1 Tax=Lipomyces arxii TaxID=56418 RepID=UPI0034CFC53A